VELTIQSVKLSTVFDGAITAKGMDIMHVNVQTIMTENTPTTTIINVTTKVTTTKNKSQSFIAPICTLFFHTNHAIFFHTNHAIFFTLITQYFSH
jgi:hypothetical protein